AQVDAIQHEVRSLSFINPGPLTRRLDNLDQPSILNGGYANNRIPEGAGVNLSISSLTKDSTPLPSNSFNMQSKATTYARLAEAPSIKNVHWQVVLKLRRLKMVCSLLSCQFPLKVLDSYQIVVVIIT
ncbi:hypothetical protein KIW84_012158, partial [Lathyrus oleraceus]